VNNPTDTAPVWQVCGLCMEDLAPYLDTERFQQGGAARSAASTIVPVRCWFCQANEADPASEARVHVGDADRTIDRLRIPRCAGCKSTHARSNGTHALLIVGVSYAVAAAVGFRVSDSSWWATMLLALLWMLVPAALLFAIYRAVLGSRTPRNPSTLQEHPQVRAALSRHPDAKASLES
jgi:hypothetical protein